MDLDETVANDTMAADFTRALDFDRHRRAVDDAKKRGVAQRCNYDAFHQLVLGANLKPVSGSSWVKDLQSGPTSSHFNRFCTSRSSAPLSSTTSALAFTRTVALTAATTAPRNLDEFSRAWRRLGGDDMAKTDFLLECISIDSFEIIFKVRRVMIERFRLTLPGGRVFVGGAANRSFAGLYSITPRRVLRIARRTPDETRCTSAIHRRSAHAMREIQAPLRVRRRGREAKGAGHLAARRRLLGDAVILIPTSSFFMRCTCLIVTNNDVSMLVLTGKH